MKILYIIALLSFAALAWAAVAITQHVRRKAQEAKASIGSDAELSQAIDSRIETILRPAPVRARSAPPVAPVEASLSSHAIEDDPEIFEDHESREEPEMLEDEPDNLYQDAEESTHPEHFPTHEDSRWNQRP